MGELLLAVIVCDMCLQVPRLMWNIVKFSRGEYVCAVHAKSKGSIQYYNIYVLQITQFVNVCFWLQVIKMSIEVNKMYHY